MTNEYYGPQPPKGFSRFLYRLPIQIYRFGLGFLLGKRFLLLEHIGRKTGLPRHAVLEVIRHDPGQDAYYVVSGFGRSSDWYQNITKEPRVRIQVGRQWMRAYAETLSSKQATTEILDYAARYPKTFRILAEKLLGVQVGESQEDIARLAEGFNVVRIGMKMGNGEKWGGKGNK